MSVVRLEGMASSREREGYTRSCDGRGEESSDHAVLGKLELITQSMKETLRCAERV